MGGLRFGVDIEALASMIGTLKIQPPFEHASSRWSRSLSRSSGPGYCVSLFFQSRRKLLEFESFFYVSHAGEQAGGTEAFHVAGQPAVVAQMREEDLRFGVDIDFAAVMTGVGI